MVLEYSSSSGAASDYSSDTSGDEFDYISDMPEEIPLSGAAEGLVITSTPEGRFVYWPDQKPPGLFNPDDL